MFARTVESPELKKLTRLCPEDGTPMNGTGKMHYYEPTKSWFIEYWCPTDEELFNIEAPETSKVANDIAKKAASKC